ncbi:hypothetical protein GKR65_04415 [Providencia alcalifaciens]|nr:hypothetical protein [Providencia alcalifaciens]
MIFSLNSQTPKLPNSQTPKLPNSQTPKLPNSQTPKLPNSQTPKLPNSQTPKLPNSQTPKLFFHVHLVSNISINYLCFAIKKGDISPNYYIYQCLLCVWYWCFNKLIN